ncbi:DUF2920 family protein [Paenibacillus sp. KN14-4R]|uniref:DUF2920 family protein n=1 Tax=Paenibacillus sp. KN14-4R TaxID=3445773 RepID=UPI003F9EC434
MAKEYTTNISAHPSIYKSSEREMPVYFCEPDLGVNEETGILLMIPGFAGHANSNVYKKMRKEFSDQYNLVTVQCDYFGWEFMQGFQELEQVSITEESLGLMGGSEKKELYPNGKLSATNLMKLLPTTPLEVIGKCKLNENRSNFNDMGIMQVLDNITAVLVVSAILKDNHLKYNPNRIWCYGQSHGSYLSYMCNAFAPSLFSLIIDNSAWIFPEYLKTNRMMTNQIGQSKIHGVFDYLARQEAIYDEEILDLNHVYRMFSNQCNIIAYHGQGDQLVSHTDKQLFCQTIDKCMYKEISLNDVDGEIIKSTGHGLDADFLKLFEQALSYFPSNETKIKHDIDIPNVSYVTKKARYEIDYSQGVPMMERHQVIMR